MDLQAHLCSGMEVFKKMNMSLEWSMEVFALMDSERAIASFVPGKYLQVERFDTIGQEVFWRGEAIEMRRRRTLRRGVHGGNSGGRGRGRGLGRGRGAAAEGSLMDIEAEGAADDEVEAAGGTSEESDISSLDGRDEDQPIDEDDPDPLDPLAAAYSDMVMEQVERVRQVVPVVSAGPPSEGDGGAVPQPQTDGDDNYAASDSSSTSSLSDTALSDITMYSERDLVYTEFVGMGPVPAAAAADLPAAAEPAELDASGAADPAVPHARGGPLDVWHFAGGYIKHVPGHNKVTAFCPLREGAHGNTCTLSRTLRADPRRAARGRPIGLLAAWILVGRSDVCSCKEEHKCLSDLPLGYEARKLARRRLAAECIEAESLFALERDVTEGEGSEPEGDA